VGWVLFCLGPTRATASLGWVLFWPCIERINNPSKKQKRIKKEFKVPTWQWLRQKEADKVWGPPDVENLGPCPTKQKTKEKETRGRATGLSLIFRSRN
jgi:hypothetical protein